MNTKAISLIYIIILLSFSNTVSAKDFYWIEGSGNWNDISHWSDQPGGQVNPDATVPNFSDNVFFDENSFPTPGAVVVINDVANCANMDWSKVTNFPKLEADTEPAHFLTISGSLKLGTDMLLDLLKPLYFSSTTLGNEIDFAGHTYNEDIHFSKNGGWIIKTPLYVQDRIIYFEQGNLSFEADVTCGQIISDNPISRTWSLNNSTITLTGSETSVLNINTNYLNFNAGTSSIITSRTKADIQISGNTSISFNNVEFQQDGAIITNPSLEVIFNDVEFKSGVSLQGPNTFNNLTFTQGNSYQIYAGSTQTVLGLWTAVGTCSEHIYISGTGGSGNIKANTSLLAYLNVSNIIASGSAAFKAENSFNLGGNSSDWDFIAPLPQNYIWIGGTDDKWSTPDNWDQNCVPSRIDNATINGAFSVEIDVDAECNNLTLSDNVTLSGTSKLSIYGSLNAGDATWNLQGATYFKGSGTNDISINKPFKADVYFSEETGVWELKTQLNIPDNTLYFESGTINSNDKVITLNSFVSIGDITRTLNLGASKVKLNGTIDKTWDAEGNSFNIPESDYTFELINPKAGFYNNLRSSVTYNKVHFTDDREKANLTNEGVTVNFVELKFSAGANISGNHNYDSFILSAGKTYSFETGSEQKIINANGFVAIGTCSEFIYLEGDGGISTIISDVDSDQIKFVQITDLEVTDGSGTIKTPGLDAKDSFGIQNYDGWNIIEKTEAQDFKWTGADDHDWFNPNNWDRGCVPTRIDNVFFDAVNITTGSKIIAINGTRVPECNNMEWSNASDLTFEGNSDLYIYGNLDFTSLPKTSYTHTGNIYFKSEDIVDIKFDQVIPNNDVIFEGKIQEDGSSWSASTWNIESNFETLGNINLERGTLISNNYKITCKEFHSNYSAPRSLQLGASILKVDDIFLTPENLTFDAGTSEINVNENGTVEVTDGDNVVDFHNISFNSEIGTALFSIYGTTVSFNQIDVQCNANFYHKGFDVDNLILNQGKTYKFQETDDTDDTAKVIYNIGNITANGACEGTIDISSLTTGSRAVFNNNSGTPISVYKVNLQDVHAIPDANFTANNSIDLGNTNGWIFPPTTTPTARNLYWVGGTGVWDDPNHWATSSGGTPGACVPTALDNVYFDAKSFSPGSNTVFTGSGDIRCKTMDWTGSEGASPNFKMGAIEISSVYIYGSFILNKNLTIRFRDDDDDDDGEEEVIPDYPVDFYFRSTEEKRIITSYGFVFPNDVSFDGIGGEWTLTDDLSIGGSLIIDNGSFISGGNDIICEYFESKDFTQAGKIRTIDIQNSTLTVLGFEDSFLVYIDVSSLYTIANTLTLLTDGSEIIIEYEKGKDKEKGKVFYIGGLNPSNAGFNTIKFKHTNILSTQNFSPHIKNLIFEEGGELAGNLDIGKLTLNKGTNPNTFKFESGITFPIEEFTALGSCNSPIDIRGSKAGKQANLNVTTSVNADFIELTDINGIDSGVSYIATNSIKDDATVTNWKVKPITGVDLYWVGKGSNDDWSNFKNWSKTSGGTSEGCTPTELDNVIFDSNSFLGSKTVLINADASCHNMTWTDDVDPSSIFTVQNQLEVYGFLDFSENMTLEMSGDLKFVGDGLTPDKDIDFAGKTLNNDIYFDGKNQSWVLQNELSTTGNLVLDQGSLNTMGNNMAISSFSSINSSSLESRNLNISGSIVTINATAADKSWNMIMTGSPMTFAAVNSELYFPNKGGIYCESNNDVAFGDAVFDAYGQIDVNGDGTESGKGEFKSVIFHQEGHILGDHTIYNLKFTLGYNNTIQGGRTINLTNDLIMVGVHCSPVYLESDTPGVKAYINSTKQQNIYHASLENISMTDANNHKVIGKYINKGGNDGWTESVEEDDDLEAPYFHASYPDPLEIWCGNSLTLKHVLDFPINDKTTFQWSSREPISEEDSYKELKGETSAIITVAESGFYQVTLDYGSGCKITSTLEVEKHETSNMEIDLTTTNVQCYSENEDDADGTITAVVTNGYADYTFFWTDEDGTDLKQTSIPGKTEDAYFNLAPGKYFVQVEDDKGCKQTASTEVFNAYEILINDITQKNLKCFNVSDGEISIDASGGTGKLTYYLDGDLALANNTGLSAAEYLVHVQDGNNCKSEEESIEITSPGEVTFDLSSLDISCYGDKDGSIAPRVEGGISPYSYKWTGPNDFTSNLGTISNLDGGTYTIELTDANDCVYKDDIEITEPEAIEINTLDVSNANCFGEATGELFVVAENGTAPYTYTISQGETYKEDNNYGLFTGLSANIYSLKITDNNGCVKPQPVTIGQPENELGFTVKTVPPSCENLKDGIINVAPYGGNSDYTFSWSGPNDFRSYYQNINDLEYGEYVLLLKDKKECVYKDSVNLAKNRTLQLGLIIEEEVSVSGANDGILKLEIRGGKTPYTYDVYGPSGYHEPSPYYFDGKEATFKNLAGGLYTVTVTDQGSCGSITKDIMLSEGDLLTSQIVNEENISCTGSNDGTLDATAIGGNGIYSYSWTGPSGYTSNTQSISGLAAGTYILTVQSDGQIATDQAIIVEPTPIVASSTPNNVSCFNEPNGSIELDISGGTKPYSIMWEGERGFLSHSDKIYDLAEGDYDYQVTDARGCTTSNSVTISQPDVLTIKPDPKDITGAGERDGTLIATATGGTKPYIFYFYGPNHYSITKDPDFTGTQSIGTGEVGLEQGVYTVKIEDANDCIAITETRIYRPEIMVVSLVAKTTPICHGGSEGSIEVLIEDGSGDYTLSWKSDNYYENKKRLITTETSIKSKIENLKAGNYILTVTDNVPNAYSGKNEVIRFKQEVKEPDKVEVDVSMNQISCYELGHINIYPKGGTPNYTYEWSSNIDPANRTNEDQDNLNQGIYSVIVTDSKKCTYKKDSLEINPPTILTSSSSFEEPSCYGDKNGSVELDITSDAFPCLINWSNGAITEDIDNLRKGTYSYTITDSKGCEILGTVDLTQPDSLIAEINDFTDVICYGQNNGTATATVTGGTSDTANEGTKPYTYNWSNDESTPYIDDLRPNKYNLIVTDEHDCQDTASVVIEEPEKLLLRVEAHRPTIEGAKDGAIFAKAIGGIPDYTAIWEREKSSDMWGPKSETDLEINDLEINDLDRGKYKVTLTDKNSCARDTIINLEYLYDINIEIPSAFTPNGDGYNEDWDILRIEYIQRLKIVIYNRLGNVVYKFSGTGNEYKGNRWEGRTNKSLLPVGSYYYVIEADDSKPLTGSVTIAR